MTLDWIAFVGGLACALFSSSILVRRIERIGARLGLSEALLGMFAALAADGPEISSSVTALLHGQGVVGVGVILGSNVFNLAALLGVGALVAGRISFRRDVIVFEGVVAFAMALVAYPSVQGSITPVVGLCLTLVLFVPYVAVSSMSSQQRSRIPLPVRALVWLTGAIEEEEREIHEATSTRPASLLDVVGAAFALLVVIVSSVVMERSATTLGPSVGISEAFVGGVILAATTSLPNAVAAVYLARRGRGSAMYSEAMNSNSINIIAGLLLPAFVAGATLKSAPAVGISLWFIASLAVVLVVSWVRSGIGRLVGVAIIVIYLVFVVTQVG